MRTCYMCGETKPAEDFAFANLAKGTRQRHCRNCQAAYRRAHYVANRNEYIRREVARINNYRLENRASLLAYLVAHPCVDCGEPNPVMLDFDHRDPSEKKGNVSELAMRKPWRLVLVEIAKCDVRCANCHLRRTAHQFNWRKLRGLPATRSTAPARRAPTGELTSLEVALTEATKTCTGCGLARPLAEFPIKHKKTGCRATRCRACRSQYGKLHYQKNRATYLSRAKSRGRVRRESYLSWLLTYLASHPCLDCKETDPVVLQFDHRDGMTKVATVGALLNRASWATLLAEVAKCDVRCANCHRVKTAERLGWSKLFPQSA